MVYRQTLTAPVFGLRREIDRLFEDTFGRGEGMNAWTPPVDVRETDKEVRIDVELPGVPPDEVEITAENGVLTIAGQKQMERKEDEQDGRFHVVERMYGAFARSFQLPKGLDETKIEADFDHGMLTIRLPKAALPQPRRIQIGANRTTTTQQSQQTQQNQPKTAQRTSSSSSSGAAQPASRAASSAQGGSGEGNR